MYSCDYCTVMAYMLRQLSIQITCGFLYSSAHTKAWLTESWL